MQCDWSIATICLIDKNEQTTFKSIREKSYLKIEEIQLKSADKKERTSSSQVEFINKDFKLNAPAPIKKHLEMILQKRMQQELIKVRKELKPEYSSQRKES